jgi:hypothetical protein
MFQCRRSKPLLLQEPIKANATMPCPALYTNQPSNHEFHQTGKEYTNISHVQWDAEHAKRMKKGQPMHMRNQIQMSKRLECDAGQKVPCHQYIQRRNENAADAMPMQKVC